MRFNDTFLYSGLGYWRISYGSSIRIHAGVTALALVDFTCGFIGISLDRSVNSSNYIAVLCSGFCQIYVMGSEWRVLKASSACH